MYTPEINLSPLREVKKSRIDRYKDRKARSLDVLPFTVKSKVLQILTYIRQERLNEQYRNTAKDLLLPNTFSQKDEKPHTTRLDDTAIPHTKIKITEIALEKKLNTAIP